MHRGAKHEEKYIFNYDHLQIYDRESPNIFALMNYGSSVPKNLVTLCHKFAHESPRIVNSAFNELGYNKILLLKKCDSSPFIVISISFYTGFK